MGLLVRASDGEIIEIGTGISLGFENADFPQLTTDASTLLRFFDGASAESLGIIPKIITLSRAEQKLLGRLRPWRFLKYAQKQAYLKLLDRRNAQQLSIRMSVVVTNLWADPTSIFNTPEHRLRKSLAVKALWRDPTFRQKIIDSYTPERLLVYSERAKHLWTIPEYRNSVIRGIKARWTDPDSYCNSKESRQNKSLAMLKLCEDPNCVYKSAEFGALQSVLMKERRADPNSVFNTPEYIQKQSEATRIAKRTPKARQRASIATRRVWAWKRLAQVMDMLFGGIVNEDAPTFPYPHCNRVFGAKSGLGQHITDSHVRKASPGT